MENLYNNFEVGYADVKDNTPNKIQSYNFKKAFSKVPCVLAIGRDTNANYSVTIRSITKSKFSFVVNYTGNTTINYLAFEF